MNTDQRLPLLSGLLAKFRRFDWSLFVLIAALSAIGVLALYSVAGGSFTPWASRQLLRLAAAFAVMLTVAMIPIRTWRSGAIPFYIFALSLLALSIFFGETAKGATRWLDIGFVRIQPSEFAKIAVIVLLAVYYSKIPRAKVSSPIWVALPASLILLPAALVAVQPDLGTAVLIALGGGVVMFLAGVHLYYFASVIFAGAGVVVLVFLTRDSEWQFLKDYHYRRIDTFLDPASDPLGAGYHITQSKIAIGSGGLNGRGFLQGTQSQLNFLPEKHTDFVFTTLAEEFGLIWCLILVAIYATVILICTLRALHCRQRFCSLIILGMASMFFLHFIANIAMITGLIPVVGVTLPLISFGGSSLLVLMIAFGLIQSALIYERELEGPVLS